MFDFLLLKVYKNRVFKQTEGIIYDKKLYGFDTCCFLSCKL